LATILTLTWKKMRLRLQHIMTTGVTRRVRR
jgi:hypothetical protein